MKKALILVLLLLVLALVIGLRFLAGGPAPVQFAPEESAVPVSAEAPETPIPDAVEAPIAVDENTAPAATSEPSAAESAEASVGDFTPLEVVDQFVIDVPGSENLEEIGG